MTKVHQHVANTCQSFSLVSDLQAHVEFSHVNAKKTHQCKLCDKNFERKDSLTEHVKVIHEGFRYNCDDCGKVMKSRTHAIEHAKIHAKNYVKKIFKCDLCEASMGSMYGYKQHMQKHENKNQVVCEACGKNVFRKI
nr:unnamed protein product [Callosobruchus analis]